MDQEKFIEMVEEIKTIASAQKNKMTKEEIGTYFSDMGFDEAKMEAVYQYLAVGGVQIDGYHLKVEQEKKQTTPEQEVSKEDNKKDSSEENVSRAKQNLKFYTDEVSAFREKSTEEEKELFHAFFAGDVKAREEIIHGKLRHVMEIARSYEKRKVSMDEVIEEGNLGLMIGMSVIEQNKETYYPNGMPDMAAILGTLDMEIKQQIEQMLDEEMQQKDWEDTVLAKTNLLHEAAKYLAEEIGRVATREELSKYTKISEEEIKEIMGLSEDAKKVMKPE